MTQLKERDYFFDNARMILIFLVVFGHLLQPYT
ncbi:acetyltransferase, partial [Staphylococcus cohnii]